jgi:ubiquinone/menaquinone biosynthesis C-methylase UbiE
MTDDADGWNEIAIDYEKHAVPSMKPYSTQAFEFANLSTNANLKVIDVACGPGPMAEVFVEKFPKGSGDSLLATDFAKGMVDLTKEKAVRNGWTNVEAKVMDAMVRFCVIWSCPISEEAIATRIKSKIE